MKVLIVEDDRDLSGIICRKLKLEGFEIDACFDGMEAVSFAIQYQYELIILDRMLPNMDGMTVLKEIRKKSIKVPVIMVTAMDKIPDRIIGLDAGADDYLVKPFAMEELLARVRALLRRPANMEENRALSYSNLHLHFQELLLKSDSMSVSLSKKESALLEFFFLNHDQTLTREQIILRIWGPEADIEDGNLDNYIYFLRRRLKAVHSKATIKTVHGLGYRLEET